MPGRRGGGVTDACQGRIVVVVGFEGLPEDLDGEWSTRALRTRGARRYLATAMCGTRPAMRKPDGVRLST